MSGNENGKTASEKEGRLNSARSNGSDKKPTRKPNQFNNTIKEEAEDKPKPKKISRGIPNIVDLQKENKKLATLIQDMQKRREISQSKRF